jgi:hypothetical protein
VYVISAGWIVLKLITAALVAVVVVVVVVVVVATATANATVCVVLKQSPLPILLTPVKEEEGAMSA